MQSPLYFAAILLPADIQQAVRTFQQQAAEQFQSKRALRNPPHITLLPPFRFPNKHNKDLSPQEGQVFLENQLHQFAERPDIQKLLSKLHIELRDFDFFPPRVVFIQVRSHAPLIQLQSELQKATSKLTGFPPSPKRPFHPHVTIAYRDLSEVQFPLAKKYFEQQHYRAHFQPEGFHLLKHVQGQWKVVAGPYGNSS